MVRLHERAQKVGKMSYQKREDAIGSIFCLEEIMTHLVGPPLNEVTDAWLAELRQKFPKEIQQGIQAFGGEPYFLMDLAAVGKIINDGHEEEGSENYIRLLNEAKNKLADHGVCPELIQASEELGRLMIARAQELVQAEGKNLKRER